jgi:hypothetical protein
VKILDSLEEDCAHDCLHPRDVKRILPALIRVARAAETLRHAVSDHLGLDWEECWNDFGKPERELNEALQQLRDLSEGETE